jgi:hypothetical protein
MPIPAIAFRFIGRNLLKQTDAQGYGKHTKEERKILYLFVSETKIIISNTPENIAYCCTHH